VVASGLRLVAEQLVPLRRELAAVVARSPYGQGAAWPVVETVQADGICVEVVAPAPGCPRSWLCRRRTSRCGWPMRWTSSACWPSSCSRSRGRRAGRRWS
jgi:hypothetical protein